MSTALQSLLVVELVKHTPARNNSFTLGRPEERRVPERDVTMPSERNVAGRADETTVEVDDVDEVRERDESDVMMTSRRGVPIGCG